MGVWGGDDVTEAVRVVGFALKCEIEKVEKFDQRSDQLVVVCIEISLCQCIVYIATVPCMPLNISPRRVYRTSKVSTM